MRRGAVRADRERVIDRRRTMIRKIQHNTLQGLVLPLGRVT